MTAIVSAGLAGAAHIASSREPGVVASRLPICASLVIGRSKRRSNVCRRRVAATKLLLLPPYAATRTRSRHFYRLRPWKKYGFFGLN